MPRLLFLAATLLSTATSLGQGVGEFSLITQSFDESMYKLFVKVAREDSDSTKVVMLRALYGRHLIQQQRYPEAETELYEVLAIIKKMEGSLRYSIKLISSSIYDTYDYLGEYYTETGDYKKAEFLLKQSEQLRALHFSRGSPHRIYNLQNMAEFYLTIGQTKSSEVYLLKLNTELNHTRFNNEMLKSAYGTYFRGMTEVCIRGGRLKEAKYFFKKLVKYQTSGLTSYKKALGSISANSKTVFFYSQVLLMEGKLTEALTVAQRGVDQGPDSLKFLPPLLQTKAICLFRLHKITESLATAHSLLEVHLHNIKKVFNTLNEQEKETMFNRVKDDFDLFNSLIITAAADNRIDELTLESLLNFRLQTKALLMNNSLKIRQAIYSSHDSTLIKNYRQLALLKNKASQEVFKKSDKQEIAGYEEGIKVLEKSISRKVAALSNAIDVPLNYSDLQNRLTDQDGAIEIIRVRKLGVSSRIRENNQPVYSMTDTVLYFSVILTRGHIDYALVRNGNELEERYFKLFKNEVLLVTKDTTLYHAFWSPIGKKVKMMKTLYFSGDGIYNQININLLQGRDGYLQDQFDIVLLSNLKELIKGENFVGKGTAIFFGQPNFQLTVQSHLADERRDVRNVQMEEMKEVDFKDLPGTRIEIANGSKILMASGWKTQSYLGDDALESRLKSTSNPELLHIATHGFFIEGAGINPMLRSGLIFSGVKNEEDIQGEDGVLTAYEASSLALDSTRLVVLSACETGTGEVRTGEGVYGLQRAFLIAGARNIIMSLWKVDDLATEKLMTLFYSNLSSHKNIRSAFTDAQKKLRQEYPEPFYWGAFVLIGK